MAKTKNYHFYNFFTKLAHKHIVDLFANSMEFESSAVVYDTVNKEVSMIHCFGRMRRIRADNPLLSFSILSISFSFIKSYFDYFFLSFLYSLFQSPSIFVSPFHHLQTVCVRLSFLSPPISLLCYFFPSSLFLMLVKINIARCFDLSSFFPARFIKTRPRNNTTYPEFS